MEAPIRVIKPVHYPETVFHNLDWPFCDADGATLEIVAAAALGGPVVVMSDEAAALLLTWKRLAGDDGSDYYRLVALLVRKTRALAKCVELPAPEADP